jgi:hypothetical protein
MIDIERRQAGASKTNILPHANLGMVRAGISALEEARRHGDDSKENGDANVVYAVFEAMLKKYQVQCSGDED